MGLRLGSVKGLVLIIGIALGAAGCGFDGKVYVTFHWDAGDTPTTFTTSIPNVPSNIASLTNSQLYRTLPGTFTITTDYPSIPTPNVRTVTLKSGLALVGEEDFYYYIILSPGGIDIRTVP